MPYQINCELCGTLITAERRSKQYCDPCRPKAVFLNRMLDSLNVAAYVDPLVVSALVGQSVRLQGPSALGSIMPILEGQLELSVMTLFNLALREFAPIAWNGQKFEIVRWLERQEIMMGLGTEVPAANAADTFRGLHNGEFVGTDERTPARDVTPTDGQRLDGIATRGRARALGGARGLSPSDQQRIIGPGTVTRSQGLPNFNPR